MLATLLAAAEPSKVPWYVAGSALAIWAVILAVTGLTRPAFPYGQWGARGVMLLSFTVAVVAIAMSIVSG